MNVYRHVQATTASDLTLEGWRNAWTLAAPIVVAANRYIEAERDGKAGLIEDAHFQLLRAIVRYKDNVANAERDESDKAVEQAERKIAFTTETLTATVNLANERVEQAERANVELMRRNQLLRDQLEQAERELRKVSSEADGWSIRAAYAEARLAKVPALVEALRGMVEPDPHTDGYANLEAAHAALADWDEKR